MFEFILFALISSVPLWIFMGIYKLLIKIGKNVRREYFLYPGLVILISLSISYFSVDAASIFILIAGLFAVIWGILSVIWRTQPDKNKLLTASLITSVFAVFLGISYYSVTAAANLSFLMLLFLLGFGIITFLWRNKTVGTGKRLLAAAGATTSFLGILLVLMPLAAAFLLLLLIWVL